MRTSSTCEEPTASLQHRLRRWFGSEAGQRLMQAEQALLKRMSEGLFGYYLVDVQGVAKDLSSFSDCPIRHKLRLAANAEELPWPVDVLAESERLPLRGDAIDVVVLHHCLDFALDPHQVLREAERVLIPEGRVLIVGFNPFSLWGLWRLPLRRPGRVPWCGHFLSYRRVVDWLGLLGFDIEYTDVAAFVPPLPQQWEARMGAVEGMGRRLMPMFAGIYVIRAVKRVSTVTPLRLRWHALRVLSPSGVVEPSAMVQANKAGKRK